MVNIWNMIGLCLYLLNLKIFFHFHITQILIIVKSAKNRIFYKPYLAVSGGK